MARLNTRQSYNVEIAVTGKNPTDELPFAVAERKEAKLLVASQLELAADRVSARELVLKEFGKQDKENDGSQTDSHNSRRAIARAIFWDRRRAEKNDQCDTANRRMNSNETSSDEVIGEKIVEAINLGEISQGEIEILKVRPFRKLKTPREEAVMHLTA